ncbi:class I SAM-dependent methyltransferase [bacterium]|nr:class I SAM-dependent methyltransferase [bacterium]
MSSTFDTTIFGSAWDTDWHMQGGERTALLYLLSTIRPTLSLEIGTFRGGSLRPISHFSKKTYTFDIDPLQHRMAPSFPTVEFITGDTAVTLPPIIETIARGPLELNFVLVDGSHETAGVRHDITCCLRYVPRSTPCVIVMHDSANPAVREGILSAPWHDSPHAHALDVDFVPGALYERPDVRDQLWGGIAVGLLMPGRRTGAIDLRCNFAHTLARLAGALATGSAPRA